MVEPRRDPRPAARGLVFGLVSLGIHAGARIYHEVGKRPPEPEKTEAGLDEFLGQWVDSMRELDYLVNDLPSTVRTMQVMDLAATVFAILGVSYAAIAGHRGDRGVAMWLAWCSSVVGLLLWAGQIPLGWRL